MSIKYYISGVALVGALAMASVPAVAQGKKLTRDAALKKCIAVMTQYVKFDGKAEADQDRYNPAGNSQRYNNLYANCMADHGQKP